MPLESVDVVSQYGLTGLAAVILSTLARGAWKACVWVGVQILIPMRDRHAQFLASLQLSIENQQRLLREMADAQTAGSAELKSQGVEIQKLRTAVEGLRPSACLEPAKG